MYRPNHPWNGFWRSISLSGRCLDPFLTIESTTIWIIEYNHTSEKRKQNVLNRAMSFLSISIVLVCKVGFWLHYTLKPPNRAFANKENQHYLCLLKVFLCLKIPWIRHSVNKASFYLVPWDVLMQGLSVYYTLYKLEDASLYLVVKHFF